MVTADLSTESISLAIGFFAAAILVFLSLYPPQTTPSSAHEALPQDAMGVTSTGVAIRRLLLLSLWLFHAASALS